MRKGDLSHRERGEIEQLFRERLEHEGIPILMSPPVRQVPGILVNKRKPDGVYPDPSSGQAPAVYLEIKNIRRVSDDIQKRLYEVAEASLEVVVLMLCSRREAERYRTAAEAFVDKVVLRGGSRGMSCVPEEARAVTRTVVLSA